MKSTPKAPTPPDPVKTAEAQTASNLSTAIANAELNRVPVSTPWGNLDYTVTGTNPDGTPQYSQSITLSPTEQQKFDLAQQGDIALANTGQGMLGQVNDAYSQPFSLGGAPSLQSGVPQSNYSGLPSMPTSVPTSDYSGAPGIRSSVYQDGQTTANAIKQAQDAAYSTQTQYLDPQFQRDEAALRNRLANQGITDEGSEAYRNAMDQFNAGKNQAYQGARNAAMTAGLAEQNTLFGQAAQDAALGNQAHSMGVSDANNIFNQNITNAGLATNARQQGVGEANTQFSQGLQNAELSNNARNQYISQLIAQRNQPLNEYNALMTGSQVSQPVFPNTPTANMAGTNVADITQNGYNNQMNAYNAKLASQNAMMQSLFGLGGQLGAAAIL
jgi:hypothetical protein